MKRRRNSSRATMKPALVSGWLPRRVLLLLSSLVLVLLLIFIYLVSFRHILKQDAHSQTAKTNYTVYTFEVVNEYNHDSHAFTQGLVYAGNDTLYESTGMYGSSSVRKVHVQSGKVSQLHKMETKYFGEGLTLLNNRLLQVAWRITSGFIYDVDTLSMLGSFRHPMRDGWGLATDGKVIYGSDGTSTIYVMQPSTFKEDRRLLVKDQNLEITELNELEYIDGELWANVWLTDCIVRISPLNGQVLGWILLHELKKNLQARNYRGIDVLNGIAWDHEQSRIFVTGKYWPKLYEIKVQPHADEVQDRKHVWERCRVNS